MAVGIGPGTTVMYMQRTTSNAAGNGLYTTIKKMRGAAGIGLGITIKYLRRKTSGAAGNGLGITIKYLRRTKSAAANNGLSTTINPPCSVASFEVNSEPHTGARPSARLCVGPEPARCVHMITQPNLKAAFIKNRGLYGFRHAIDRHSRFQQNEQRAVLRNSTTKTPCF
jgi:hypothetical protein